MAGGNKIVRKGPTTSCLRSERANVDRFSCDTCEVLIGIVCGDVVVVESRHSDMPEAATPFGMYGLATEVLL